MSAWDGFSGALWQRYGIGIVQHEVAIPADADGAAGVVGSQLRMTRAHGLLEAVDGRCIDFQIGLRLCNQRGKQHCGEHKRAQPKSRRA